MNEDPDKILEEALHLPMASCASIADKLLASLGAPDSLIDNLWKKEVDAHISATQQGNTEIIPEEEVFKDI
jgi:hypothetical protein